MSWTLLVALVAILGVVLAAAGRRRIELARMRRSIDERDRLHRLGSREAQLQHPVIDLSRCLGCGSCVAACPEGGVLELVHGQAAVVNGAACTGIAACERVCPVGAVTVTVANLAERNDIPAVTGELEAVGSPGLFLAGEVTAKALIKGAVEQGTAVASEVSRRIVANHATRADRNGVLDLCIVGAGPAGLACALESQRHDLHFVVIDQQPSIGGTVARYPRRKLVLTQPVDLPTHGRLDRPVYTKEELIELWQGIADRARLPVEGSLIFEGLTRDEADRFVVQTQAGAYVARHVCLAIGRRGVPRRLGVPGEELLKVSHSLLDAASFEGRRLLVVGGGDSAVEAAIALARQPGNEVTLSYRRDAFFRLRSVNRERLESAVSRGEIEMLFGSEVVSIEADSVDLAIANGHGTVNRRLPNDEVFVMVGGIPPTDLLAKSGVSHDPALRPAPPPIRERGTQFVRAIAVGFVLSLGALAWALWHSDYYLAGVADRPAIDKHSYLRPGLGVGLGLGIASSAMILLNLAYLARKSPRIRFELGSLPGWMTCHVATGILAFLCAVLHGAMTPRDTLGGHSLWALALLMVTGGIGRYFYAYLPRAANGRELELDEVKAQLGGLFEATGSGPKRFAGRARDEVLALAHRRQWKRSFLGRVTALLRGQVDLRRVLRRIEEEGRREGVPPVQRMRARRLARKAHRTAIEVAHCEDLRALLGTWRYFHRWIAVLMLLLVVLHVVYALAYGTVAFEGGTS